MRYRALVVLLGLLLALWVPAPSTAGGDLAKMAPRPASGPRLSDFNGDGLGDVAIGAPTEKVGSALSAGAVNVLYGSTAGLQTGAPEDQIWTQDSPDVEDQAESSDRFGSSLIGADFNGDGFTDLAIGAKENLEGVAAIAGAVNVLYGSALGLQTTSPEDQFWTQDSPDVEDAAESGDRFSAALAGADFNGDGFHDLAIGVPFESVDTRPKAGAVNILYGSATGLQTIAPVDQVWTQNSPDVEDAAQSGDRFGWTFAVGDYNADSFADLAIGAIMESLEGVARSAGAVNVLYGSATGLQATDPADQWWTQDSPDVEEQLEPRDRLGWSLAAGDFNGDGYADLAMAAPFEDLVILGAGGVHVLYGSAAGLQATSPEDQWWTQDSPDVEDQSELRDWFGWSVVAADFNGDQFADLAVGVRVEDVGDVPDAGAVNVLYGSASGLQVTSPEDQFWTQDSPGVDEDAEQEDEFGWALGAADFGDDGFGDLIVGVPLEDVGAIPNAGAVNVLYGSALGLQTDAPEEQLWTQNSPDVEDQSEPGDEFGSAFAGGAPCPHPCHSPVP